MLEGLREDLDRTDSYLTKIGILVSWSLGGPFWVAAGVFFAFIVVVSLVAPRG